MKKSGGILISFVVLILISYYFFGLITYNSLSKNIDAIPKTPFFSFKLDRYKGGWFSSAATLGFKMDVPAENGTDKNGQPRAQPAVHFNLEYPLTMLHGPIVFADSGIRFGIGLVTTKPQTHYHAMVNYLNNTVIRYTFPAISFDTYFDSKRFFIAIDGIQTVLQFSPDVDKASGSFKLLGLNSFVDNLTFRLSEILLAFDIKRFQESLWVGSSHVLIPLISAQKGTDLFQLEGLEITTGSDVSGGLLNVDYDTTLIKLVVENKSYGPGHIKLAIRNIDPEAMAKINKSLSNMYQVPGNPSLSKLTILAELPNLLSKGSEFDLSELVLDVSEGKISGHFKVSLPKDESKDVRQTIKKAHGEGEFKAPMALVESLMISSFEKKLSQSSAPANVPVNKAITLDSVKEQADKKLQGYLSKGLLTVDGSNYVLHIKIENEKFLVNGKVFNPGMFD